MKFHSHNTLLNGLLALAVVFALSACAANSTSGGSEPAETEPVVEIEPWDGDGMEIPLDGSSMEAWEMSLTRIKAHTTASKYQTLENAIQYHLMYDLKSYRDMEKLIKRLDGRTGYEIVELVKWRKPAPGKGQVEKGSADAKIIDS
jgi:hypothetical protein